MDSENIGIKDLKELIGLGLHIGMGYANSIKDGKWTAGDFFNFIPAVTCIPNAVDGFDNVAKQLLDVDETEKEELKKFVEDEFNIPNDNIEQAIEKGLLMGITIVQGSKEIYDLIKE